MRGLDPNYTYIQKGLDLRQRLPRLNRSEINELIAFSTAGAGFHNFDAHVDFWAAADLRRMSTQFDP